MQTHEALMGRRTVHRFRPADLPEGAVTRALEAAMMAPNHKLTCPWRFFRVGPATRQRLFQIGHRIQAQKSGQAPTAEQDLKLREKLMNPSELVVFARVRTDDAFRAREDYATLACAIQNFSLSLWDEGVASKWSTGGITRHSDTYTLLGIDPDRLEIVGFVWVGMPILEELKTPPRPPLKDVLTQLP